MYIQDIILYKDDNTGNAWWAIEIDTHEVTFDNNRQYKIHNRVYPVDTKVFRDDYIAAMRDIVFKLLRGEKF